MIFATVLAACLVALPVFADPNPTAPAPGDSFKEGSSCTVEWDADTTGVWTEMDIMLMTGDNFNMIPLTKVATVDGTDLKASPFSYTCPKVTPHSPIYFYQFSSEKVPARYWTGRFSITDATGTLTPPANSTQPNGDSIPWGTGQLVDPTAATPPPPYLNSTSSNTTATGIPPTNATTSANATSSTTNALTIVPTITPAGSASSTKTQTATATSNSNTSGAKLITAERSSIALLGVAVIFAGML